MDDAQIVAPQRKFKGKTACDWNAQREPWRTIGRLFAAECRAIVGGVLPVKPVMPDRPSPKSPLVDGELLRTMRVAKGLSVFDVAKRVGCSRITVLDIEAGRVKHSRFLAAICAALDV
jgi:DNA-binding XRE family transcriptional regulator